MNRGEKCSGLLRKTAHGRRSGVCWKEVTEAGLTTKAATNVTGDGQRHFVRRTCLSANEYRKNFHQLDRDVISAITSEEADRVTPLMSKIYLRLASAPTEFWEREGVLYFSAQEAGEQQIKASKVLYDLLGVSSATAHKALQWMHGQGIIGYFAGKNGAGIRIFLNRAAASIGVRDAMAAKKILPFSRGSSGAQAGSNVEPAFNDSFAVSEVLENNLNPSAPKSGAGQTPVAEKSPEQVLNSFQRLTESGQPRDESSRATLRTSVPTEEIVARLRSEFEPLLKSAARQAAAQEHERTREWLESRGLPKAARVAQREAFNVLRQYGMIGAAAARAGAKVDVSVHESEPTKAAPLSIDEIRELAEACVAMLEVHGRAIERTLSELSAEAGGVLTSTDVTRVRELAEELAGKRKKGREESTFDT
jgi:hypothetical protein